MLNIFIVIAPVFALILLGFVAAKIRYLPQNAASVLAEFGFKVAMPALLFRAFLGMEAPAASPFALWAVFLSAMMSVWVLAVLASRLILRKPARDAPAIAMAATFGNTVMLGIPIGLVAFGPEAAIPMALMVSTHAPLLWLIATLQQEMSGQREGVSLMSSMGNMLRDLARNPIILSLIAGASGALAGLSLDPVSDRILTMLGAAAVPSALFALGMTLAGFRLSGQSATLVTICILKLLVYPLFAWIIVRFFIDLPPVWAKSVILFSALPVGANAYLFASRYDRQVGSVSAAIALSSLIAAGSLTVVLGLLGGTISVEWMMEWIMRTAQYVTGLLR